MSSGGESHQESGTSPRRERRESTGVRRATVIEFVDSQDPNVRSAIQRHTAYHSAAQRRDARTRSLQSLGQSRFLPWGRRTARENNDHPVSSASSTSSVSISPVPSIEGSMTRSRGSSYARDQDSHGSNSRSASLAETDTTQSGIILDNSRDDAVLEFWAATHCQYNRQIPLLATAMAFMRENEASRHLLLAYAYAMRWKLQSSPETILDQVDAQTNLGRGTTILRNQLQSSGHASSDAIIQAVLLLVVYTADFGQADEVQLHVDALRTMVAQRGGINSFGHNPALQQQLWVLGSSRSFHLAFDCEVRCTSTLRFPTGLVL